MTDYPSNLQAPNSDGSASTPSAKSSEKRDNRLTLKEWWTEKMDALRVRLDKLSHHQRLKLLIVAGSVYVLFLLWTIAKLFF